MAISAVASGSSLLAPTLTSASMPRVPPHDCLWFTTEADPVWWWTDGNRSDVRITVAIPSTDPRLARYEPWLRREHPEFIRVVEEVAAKTGSRCQAWYIYFGDVPLKWKLAADIWNDGK